MKKIISIVITVTLLAPFVPQAKAETPTEKVIIVFKDKVDEELVENVNGDVEQVSRNIPVLTGEIPAAAVDLIERDKDVVAVEIDQEITINGQIQTWGIEKVNAMKAWNENFTGAGSKIAVIDTGISPHEDLVVAGGVSFTSYTKSYEDDNGHGTHVAGIIGAKNNEVGIVGIAPDASLFAVKVLNNEGTGFLSDIISGIDWAITNKMNIINLSLGAPQDSLALKQAVERAYSKGILVVASAGNSGSAEGSGDTVMFPAKYDSTIAVSALDSLNNRGQFSATGASIEVTAPGVGILSTYLNNQYVVMDGTSMAAPFVAGNLALLKQAYPNLNHKQLREKLQTTASDIGIKGRDSHFGFGLVQAPGIIDIVSVPQVAPVVNNPIPTKVTTPIAKPKPAVPVAKPVQKKKASTIVTTSKTTYKAGNTIWPTVKVVDSKTKKPIVGAVVKLTINPTKGKSKTITAKTNTKGVASFKYVTSKTVKGNYKFSTIATIKNYDNSLGLKTIRVN